MGDVAMGVLGPGPDVFLARAPPRGARRCLFGAPDPEKTRVFLESETERLDAESKARWSFDFVREVPVDGGRFAWAPVEEEDGKGPRKENIQTRITDFMRKRKLPSNPKEEPNSAEDSRKKTRRRFST